MSPLEIFQFHARRHQAEGELLQTLQLQFEELDRRDKALAEKDGVIGGLRAEIEKLHETIAASRQGGQTKAEITSEDGTVAKPH